jgi:hypothetical protein
MLERYYAYKIVSLLGLFLIIGAIWDLYRYKQTGTIKGVIYSQKGRLYATIFTLITGIVFVLWPYL